MKNIFKLALAATLTTFALTGCASTETATSTSSPGSSSSGETTSGDTSAVTVVKVGVVGEYNDQWVTVNELLEPENIQVELVKYSDYAAPNRALVDGEIDINAFQNDGFMFNDIEQHGYDIVKIGETIIAPLSLYNNKDKISSLEEISDGDKIGIPSDTTNGGRALKLLEDAGLIVCDPDKGTTPSKLDIIEYIVDIEIIEAESAMLPNLLPDYTAAVINGGNAITGGLDLQNDYIYIESIDPEVNASVPLIVNTIVARGEDADNETYLKVVEAYRTEEVAETILTAFDGAYYPAW